MGPEEHERLQRVIAHYKSRYLIVLCLECGAEWRTHPEGGTRKFRCVSCNSQDTIWDPPPKVKHDA